MLQPIVEIVLKWETTQILLLQEVCEPIEPYLEILSTVTTARFMHTFIFPFILAFSVKQYINIVILASVSHINIILLKWILAGTRPYWWINESDTFSNLTRSTLRQTHLTCETTAGNPSGHVMFTASILLFITRNMHIFFQQTPWIRRHLTPTFNYLFWNIYVGILGLIAISRMYFACHFFHQCVLGIFCGFAISHFLQDRTVNRCLTEMQRINSFLLGICFVILCVSVYYSHYLLSINPQWAVKKAFNWCKDPYFIKPETTPIYSLAREFGLLFGLILCSPLEKRFNVRLDKKWSLPVVIGIICINKFLIGQIPRLNGPLVFYSTAFFANLSLILMLLNLVPLMAKEKPKEKSN